MCAFRLYPATPGWGVRCGCVCLGFGFGCPPPPLAGVLGCVCVCLRTPLAPRHSWLGCAVWVCVFGLGFRLRPATPGWAAGVCVCVCLCARSACAPPLPARACGVWVGCYLAPDPVPWFVAGCARCPGLQHLVSVVAWHLSLQLGCGRRRASWPRVGALRLVRSGRSRCSGRLCRHYGAFPHPGGLQPRIYWAAGRGTWRPAENRAVCACPWPLPRQRRWARSASYPFGAPRWGCPWLVPPALVLGCVRCGSLRVWTRSLACPVSRTVRLSTGDSAGAPGLFRVDADTGPFGSQEATPGSRVCVCVCVPLLAGSGGPASQARFGAPHLSLWPFLVLSLSARPPPGWGCPACGCACVIFPFCAPLVFGVLCFPALDALGLGVLWSPPLFCFFFLSPPPCVFFFPVRCFFSLFGFFFFFSSFLSFSFCCAEVCWLCGAGVVCPGLWGVLVCVVVGLVLQRGPVRACALSFGAPRLSPLLLCCCLLCCACLVAPCWRRCSPLCCLCRVPCDVARPLPPRVLCAG